MSDRRGSGNRFGGFEQQSILCDLGSTIDLGGFEQQSIWDL